MSPKKTFATAGRVLKQLKHDHRTIGLVFVVPVVLITLLKYVFNEQPQIFDSLAPTLLGIFPMIMMFLISSIATLRERRSGTLERLMTMPVSKIDFMLGYALAFFLIALLQAIVVCLLIIGLLDVTILGGTLATIVGAVCAGLLGTSLGLFSSAFAKSEFQAVQFMPAIMFPQLLVCGLFVAREDMARPLQLFADVMPLTYSVDTMKQITTNVTWASTATKDVAIVLAFTLAALILGSITIRRQEKS